MNIDRVILVIMNDLKTTGEIDREILDIVLEHDPDTDTDTDTDKIIQACRDRGYSDDQIANSFRRLTEAVKG